MLLLVRHGRTATNASGRLLGHADPELDAEGRRQAAALGGAVAELARPEGPDRCRIVSSPLRRTMATAEAIGASVGVGVEADRSWIELDYGELDGTRLADVPAEVWRTWRADPTFAPPGGESLAALRVRVEEALARLVPDAADGLVVVVSHVSPIKAAVAWALGVGDEVTWRMFLSTAGMSRIAIGPNGPSLLSFNETPAGPA